MVRKEQMMFKEMRFLTSLLFLVATFLLVSCGPPPVAQITSITHNPDYPAEGDLVIFVVQYENTSTTEPLSNAVLEITYDQYLEYSDAKSVPTPDDVSNDNRFLKWNLGDLPSGQNGNIEVGFLVLHEIPKDKFELSINATISGTTSQGNSSTDSQNAVTNLIDHPTPTPTPMPVVQEYPEEGVTVELPWQTSQKAIESQKRDFDFDPLTIPVVEGYSIIRPVIYLDIFDQDDNIVNTFSPSIILTVNYTTSDIENAGTEDNLVILVYDREQELWIPCDGKNDTEKTQCTTIGSTSFSQENGYGTIKISITAWTSGTGVGRRNISQ